MMVAAVCLQIIVYGALLSVGFSLGREFTKLLGEVWYKGKEKWVAWDLARNHGILDYGVAAS